MVSFSLSTFFVNNHNIAKNTNIFVYLQLKSRWNINIRSGSLGHGDKVQLFCYAGVKETSGRIHPFLNKQNVSICQTGIY